MRQNFQLNYYLDQSGTSLPNALVGKIEKEKESVKEELVKKRQFMCKSVILEKEIRKSIKDLESLIAISDVKKVLASLKD